MLAGDNLLSSTWEHLNPVLVRSTELLCGLLDKIDTWFRKSLVSMGKHCKMLCSCARAQLGILVKTKSLTLIMPKEKCRGLNKILLTAWCILRKRLSTHKVESLLGLVPNFYLTMQWSKKTCVALQHDVLLTLKLNSNIVLASGKLKHLTCVLASKTSASRTSASLKPTRPCATLKRGSTSLNPRGLSNVY